jgi:hypothetical protein
LKPADNPGAAFEAFSARVQEEPELLEDLGVFQDVQKMADRAVELGRARGLVFTSLQVRDAWSAACGSWRGRIGP